MKIGGGARICYLCDVYGKMNNETNGRRVAAQDRRGTGIQARPCVLHWNSIAFAVGLVKLETLKLSPLPPRKK